MLSQAEEWKALSVAGMNNLILLFLFQAQNKMKTKEGKHCQLLNKHNEAEFLYVSPVASSSKNFTAI